MKVEVSISQGHENDLISRRKAIEALDVGAELLRRVLDDADVVGTDREKYKWGLEIIESSISDMKELPSEHPELDEWCDDCKEYDQERHCCPRFSRVIKAALEESERIQKVINVTLDEEKVARVVEHRKKMQERKKGKENENTVYMQ